MHFYIEFSNWILDEIISFSPLGANDFLGTKIRIQGRIFPDHFIHFFIQILFLKNNSFHEILIVLNSNYNPNKRRKTG
jgi:phenolic acid decarboxylase